MILLIKLFIKISIIGFSIVVSFLIIFFNLDLLCWVIFEKIFGKCFVFLLILIIDRKKFGNMCVFFNIWFNCLLVFSCLSVSLVFCFNFGCFKVLVVSFSVVFSCKLVFNIIVIDWEKWICLVVKIIFLMLGKCDILI